jgi:hypothetical protein
VTRPPNTAAGDVAYWRLTHAQAAHHYARLARMHADHARQLADYSRLLAGRGMVALWVWAAAIVLSLAAQVVVLILRTT